MAVPVKKTSRARRDIRRYSQIRLAPQGAVCQQCGAATRPHRVCLSCGYYKGVKVLAVSENL